MDYISRERHMFVLPKGMKKNQTEERRKFDEDLKEIKKCVVDTRDTGILTLYNVEIINE